MKTFVLILLFTSQFFAQCSKSGYDIVKTTYQSSFNEGIISKFKLELPNPDFIQEMISLVNLSERIDPSLYSDSVEQLKKFDIYSIRKFSANKT
jgi:hypothetical protein